MARQIKISGGILNIRLHPHPDGVYGEFIERLYALRKAVKVRGDRHAIISLLDRSESGDGIYSGLITTFIRIDTDEPWFDVDELKEASDNKVSRVSIPDGLHPGAAFFNFIFNTRTHRLYFQTYANGKTFSGNLARILFERLADDLRITRDFGEAKITIAQSKAGLNNVFSLPVIKRVTIVIQQPNADIFDDDFDENVENYLKELNSKKLSLVLEAEAGKSIDPKPQLRRIGESALEHGSVKVDGRDEQGATSRSTEDYPRQLHEKYDPDAENEGDAFRRMTGQ
jgi:hypothetical protein